MRDVSYLDTLSVITPNMVFMMKKRSEFEYTIPVGVGFCCSWAFKMDGSKALTG